LADAIRYNTILTDLNLNCNMAQAAGARYIAQALAVNTTLRQLIFYTNAIGDEGMTHLSHSIQINSTLLYLNLSMNKISDKGARSLLYALSLNTTIANVLLYNNYKIRDYYLTQIATYLVSNRKKSKDWKKGLSSERESILLWRRRKNFGHIIQFY